jgi:hypothetical protein
MTSQELPRKLVKNQTNSFLFRPSPRCDICAPYTLASEPLELIVSLKEFLLALQKSQGLWQKAQFSINIFYIGTLNHYFKKI